MSVLLRIGFVRFPDVLFRKTAAPTLSHPTHLVLLLPTEADAALDGELVGRLAGPRQCWGLPTVFKAAKASGHCWNQRGDGRKGRTMQRKAMFKTGRNLLGVPVTFCHLMLLGFLKVFLHHESRLKSSPLAHFQC